MGLFDKIFGRDKDLTPRRGEEKWFRLLNGYTPVFHSYNGELYESELIRAAIDARARHISKLEVTVNGTAKPSLRVSSGWGRTSSRPGARCFTGYRPSLT